MNRSPWMGSAGWALVLLWAGGCGPTAYKITPIPVDPELRERVITSGDGFAPPKIALIDVDGVLMNAPRWSLLGEGEHPVALLLEKLEKARRDSRVKALILRINSPGGTVTASDLMYEEVRRFRRETDKPVVAVFMDVAASGGYYIACAADEIIAHPTTVTGSIGVIMQTFNVAGTLAKIGVETEAIKSGPNKDAGSPFRKMKPGEREIFQGIIDELYDRFVSVVAAGRADLSPEQVRELADGRVYTARQALELGLIDRIGGLREAVAGLEERIGTQRARIVTYHRPLAWKPNIYAEQRQAPVNVTLIDLPLPRWLRRPGPTFLYLWQLGAP